MCPEVELQLRHYTHTSYRLLYGYDAVTPQQAAYCDGIYIDGNADDFFRAFEKRPAGMFAHFK